MVENESGRKKYVFDENLKNDCLQFWLYILKKPN